MPFLNKNPFNANLKMLTFNAKLHFFFTIIIDKIETDTLVPESNHDHYEEIQDLNLPDLNFSYYCFDQKKCTQFNVEESDFEMENFPPVNLPNGVFSQKSDIGVSIQNVI